MERGSGCPGVKDASMLTSFGNAQGLSPKDPVDAGASKTIAHAYVENNARAE
jgi:hypothetical protein